jgi:hypothetical protein
LLSSFVLFISRSFVRDNTRLEERFFLTSFLFFHNRQPRGLFARISRLGKKKTKL